MTTLPPGSDRSRSIPQASVTRLNEAVFTFDSDAWFKFLVAELSTVSAAGESGFNSAARKMLQKLRHNSGEMKRLRAAVPRLRRAAQRSMSGLPDGVEYATVSDLGMTDREVFFVAHKILAAFSLNQLAGVAVDVGAAPEPTRGMQLARKAAGQAWGWVKSPWYRDIADHDSGVLGLHLYPEAVARAIRLDRCDSTSPTQVDAWEDVPSAFAEGVLEGKKRGDLRHICKRIVSARVTGKANELRGGKTRTELRRKAKARQLTDRRPADARPPLAEMVAEEEAAAARRAFDGLPSVAKRLVEGRHQEKAFSELANELGFETPDSARHAYNKAMLDIRKACGD